MDSLSHFGLFSHGGVLVGTLAYQCYPLTHGWRLPSTILATDDAGFAAATLSISAHSDADMLTILRPAQP